MLILINDKHEFVKSFTDEEFEKAIETSEPGFYIAKSKEDLLAFTGNELAKLHNSLFPEKQIDRARNKEGCAGIIWKKVETFATILAPKIVVQESKSIVAANFPRISAIIIALQKGGTKAELLQQSEMLFSGNSQVSHSIRAHFNMIFPAMVLSGIMIESAGVYRWAGGSCA